MENKKNSNGGGGGFLLGLLIGMLLTLLITTKKGREILRDLMDKIIRKISVLDELGEEIENAQDFEAENDYVKPESEKIIIAQTEDKAEEKGKKETDDKSDKGHKRLFLRKPHSKN